MARDAEAYSSQSDAADLPYPRGWRADGSASGLDASASSSGYGAHRRRGAGRPISSAEFVVFEEGFTPQCG